MKWTCLYCGKERDDYTCQICGKNETSEDYLHVHHIVPYRIFEDQTNDNLITVCRACHIEIESKFLKITSIKEVEEENIVYNFSVEEDESYVANDIVSHNCRSTIRFIPDED